MPQRSPLPAPPRGWPRWPLGTKPDRLGYRTILKVQGALHTHRWDADTAYRTIENWILDRQALGRLAAAGVVVTETPVDPDDTFRKDARRYLASVTDMPSFRSRADDIALWVALFGDRPRSSIRTIEIRTALSDWKDAGYAHNTLNHRLTALKQMWKKLDEGRDPIPSNPVAGIEKYRDDSADGPPKDLSWALVRLLFAAMRPGPQKARLQLLAWAGWPQARIRRLQKTHVRWAERLVFLEGRQKGKGTPGEWVELNPRAWAALRIFARWKAWGDFDGDDLRKLFRRAAARVARNPEVPGPLRLEAADVTPYDLRHTYLTLVSNAQPDEKASASIAGHADLRLIGRYTRATTNPRVTRAMVAVNARVREVKLAAKGPRKLPTSEFRLPTRAIS